ncbi:hypothetical protein NDU88_002941 [Pleurodeles waltl]|uniref:Uncharacterized protein n=1 Tax=Pleurodeles waltl TaxID=8319 RepID=A0AAV7M4U1_PLEWA|nr:hypothetical protein NDU88_002941 [Pleurodeles waltl]
MPRLAPLPDPATPPASKLWFRWSAMTLTDITGLITPASLASRDLPSPEGHVTDVRDTRLRRGACSPVHWNRRHTGSSDTSLPGVRAPACFLTFKRYCTQGSLRLRDQRLWHRIVGNDYDTMP